MERMKKLNIYGVLALFCGLVCAGSLAAQSLVITNARIVTGKSEDSAGLIERGFIVVRDGKIVSVSAGTASVGGVRVIDAQGRTVMPGFIDSHRHVMQGDGARWLKDQSVTRMQEFLDAGFTTILSAGDALEPILELRRRLNAGELKGPRLLAVGRVPLSRPTGAGRAGVDPARIDISRPPDRPTKAATGIPHEETRAAVQALAKAGVDAIKTAIIVTPGGPEKDTLAVVAEEAKRLGLISITHAVTVDDTLAAVEAKTHVLAHTPHIGQLTEEQARKIADSKIPMMSTLGIFVPTFAEDNSRVRERTGDDNLPRFRDLDPFPMNTLSSAGQGPVNARMLWEAGITYAYGTDTSFLPRDSLSQELRPLRLVFSNKDIIRIMTRNAAAVIGRSADRGTLEPGKLADMVIVDGNPVADIQDVLKVKMVIKGGEVVVDRR
jgi:imidazolonepropionase-like amidohydrolase